MDEWGILEGGDGWNDEEGGRAGGTKGDLSGLSALKRKTIFPIGFTMRVSRLMGTAANVSLPTYWPASSAERAAAWNA